jgi:putative hemolysin
MKARLITVVVVAALGLSGAACGDDESDTRLPNPAAVYCEEQGGTVSGPEPMCELPDGTVVDAWEYYRNETQSGGAGIANPASVFCEEQGGREFGPEPMCELPDGTVIDGWEYYRENAPQD